MGRKEFRWTMTVSGWLGSLADLEGGTRDSYMSGSMRSCSMPVSGYREDSMHIPVPCSQSPPIVSPGKIR